MAANMKMGLAVQGFTTAACVLQQREMLCLISTGCKDLDSILEGKAKDLGGILETR